jgi:hypothetical protein
MRSLILAPVFAVVLAAVPASAADTAARPLMEAAGLMGHWAKDCSRPPSDENTWKLTEVEASGGVRSVERAGEDVIVTRYSMVRRIDGRDTATRVTYDDGVVIDVVYRREGDVLFAWSSVTTDGTVYVNRGLLGDGREVLRLHRCPGPPPS